MEDTMTNSCQSFWLNRYGIFAVSLASAFSANALAQETWGGFSDDSLVSIQLEYNQTETLSSDKTYSFYSRKNFRERYKKISQSEWFKKTHFGMNIGEVMTIEE